MIRALIVDDERLARSALRASLAAQGDITIIGECATAADAVDHLRRAPVDLLFLDVQMPGGDGFSVLAAVEEAAPRAVIFVTAFDQYAARAFAVYAVDYVLKPFDDERLQLAVDRALQRLRSSEPGQQEQWRALHTDLLTRPAYPSRIAVRQGDRTVLVRVSTIEAVQAEENYMRLHAEGRTYLARTTLKSMISMLDPAEFLQVSRSALVRLEAVQEVRAPAGESAMVVLQSGRQIPVSGGYHRPLMDRIGRVL